MILTVDERLQELAEVIALREVPRKKRKISRRKDLLAKRVHTQAASIILFWSALLWAGQVYRQHYQELINRFVVGRKLRLGKVSCFQSAQCASR